MILQNDYENQLKKIGAKFNNPNINWNEWYRQFRYYEEMWENYFNKIFINKIDKSKCIKIIFWESCPGGMPFPHQNYVFDTNRFKNNIDGRFDKYLKEVCAKFQIEWKTRIGNKKIEDLINELCEKNILIIDLYPTHGISLDSTNRKNMITEILPDYSITKLKEIKIEIKKVMTSFCIDSKIFLTNELYTAGFNELENKTINNIKETLEISQIPTFETYIK
jgi:hypothetical protein